MAKSSRDTRAPRNFSWIVENQLAAMAFPNSATNIEYLVENQIKHLISLSKERIPLITGSHKIEWTLIHVEEFEAPSLRDIEKFIEICEKNLHKKQAVGVHCRQGQGRTGVMAACFLVKFHNLTPDRAIVNLRLQRPGSIETFDQEKAVFRYFDFIRGTKFKEE